MSNSHRSIVRSTLSHLRRLWQRRSEARRDFKQRLGSTFEQLEPRLALTISSPLPPITGTGAHIHPVLTLIDNGHQVVIPAGVGLTSTSAFSPHTHDYSGTLHIGEGQPAGLDGGSTPTRNTNLKDFFDVWRTTNSGQSTNNPNAILDTDATDGTAQPRFLTETVDATHVLRMYVKEAGDSAPELEYDSSSSSNDIARPELYVPRDGDQIIITYENIAQPVDSPSFDTISNQTVLGGAPTWLGINGFDPTGGPLTYTVSVANPNLVTATIPTGNKSLVVNATGTNEVEYGQMTFQLFDNLVPNTTQHIESIVNSGQLSDSTTTPVQFYRIAKSGSSDFVIQGGRNGVPSSLGRMDDEFNTNLQFTTAGLLAMAKSTDDTGDAEFFVTGDATRFLDFQHTIFGVLTEGDAVRQAIQHSRASGDGPPTNDTISFTSQIITDTQNAALQLKAALGASGTTSVTVTVQDAQGHSYAQTFQVTVTPDSNNPAPFLNPIAPVAAVAGQPIAVQLSATDAQNDEVQQITRNANGSTTFSFNGVNASPINFTFNNASNPPTGTTAADVQSALSTIPALNGNIAVTGAVGGPYLVSFIGALAGKDVATIGVNNANATVQNVSPLFFDASKPASETVAYTVSTNHDTGLVTITPPAGFVGTFHLTTGVRGTATRTTIDQFDTQDVVVTVAAAAPTVDLTDGSDLGASNSDNITGASSLDFLVTESPRRYRQFAQGIHGAGNRHRHRKLNHADRGESGHGAGSGGQRDYGNANHWRPN